MINLKINILKKEEIKINIFILGKEIIKDGYYEFEMDESFQHYLKLSKSSIELSKSGNEVKIKNFKKIKIPVVIIDNDIPYEIGFEPSGDFLDNYNSNLFLFHSREQIKENEDSINIDIICEGLEHMDALDVYFMDNILIIKQN